MDIDGFLDRLDGVQPHGNYHAAVCPAHEDRQASLSVAEGEDGRIIIKCHAGCSAPEIVKALDLTLRDLFPGAARIFGEPEVIYSYVDEAGAELFQAVRMPGKKFLQRHFAPDDPDAKEDGWVWKLDDVRRVLYQLPDLIAGIAAGHGVYLTEGEKDAENVRATGRVATCNPMGAGKWRDEYSPFFTGANVTIVADRDEPGRTHANRVMESIKPYAAHVRILQSREGKDVSDHLSYGHTMEELIPIRQGPRRGVITAQQMSEAAMEILVKTEYDEPGYQMFENCPITMRNGRMYSLGAYTSDGKTRAAAQIARRIASKGTRVGYYSLEMPEADLRNIFLAHRGIPLSMLEEPWQLKGNPEMLALFEAACEEISEWHLDIIFNTKVNADYVTLTSNEREHELVIIDHVHRFAWGGERRGLESEVQKLTNLALESNIPVLLLCQLRKTQRGRDMVAYPRPSLQEFRETSIIGDDSSIAMALWRQRDDSGMSFTGGTDLTILKNRHTTGRHDAAGVVFFPDFDIHTQLFTFGGKHGADPEVQGDDLGEPEEKWGSIYD